MARPKKSRVCELRFTDLSPIQRRCIVEAPFPILRTLEAKSWGGMSICRAGMMDGTGRHMYTPWDEEMGKPANRHGDA